MSDGGITPNSTDADTGFTSPAKKDATVAAVMPKFTEKEELVLKMAWQCLKSGPPEIDIAKLMELCEFKTQKTTQNTWGAIKKKLMTMGPPSASASANGEGEDGSATPKPKATPKKRAAPKNNGEADGSSPSPAKKPRTPKKAKTPTKVKAEEDGEGEEGGEE